VLKQLIELAAKQGPKRERSPWHDEVQGWKEEWANFINPELASDATPIDPARDRRATEGDIEDTLMITDTGNTRRGSSSTGDLPAALGLHTGRLRRHGLRHVRRARRQLARPDRRPSRHERRTS